MVSCSLFVSNTGSYSTYFHFQNPLILDSTAEKDKVQGILKRMLNQIEGLQKQAFTYKSYQKNFKVEVTKFDALEEVHAELKLKELLWSALDEWDNHINEWMSVSI